MSNFNPGFTHRLVYLDTWTLSELSRVLKSDVRRFHAFKKVWKDRGSVLALSRTHLMELRRHKDVAVRAARYETIEELLPGRFDMLLNTNLPSLNELKDREVGVELLRHFGRAETLDKLPENWIGFPLPIESRENVTELREQLERQELGDTIDLLSSGLGFAAAIQTRNSGSPYERTRLSRVSVERPTDDQIAALAEQVDAELAKLPLMQQMESRFTPEQLAEGLATAREILHDMLNRAQAVGFQEALREGDVHHQSRRNEFVDVHLQNQAFSDRVRKLAAALAKGFDGAAIDRATQGLRRTNCPSVWLTDAVELELRRAKQRSEVSDWFDLDHLSHLPYVNLQFADRELASVTRQVLRRRNQLPTTLLSVNPPIATEASLDAVERQLIRSTEETDVTGFGS